MVVDEKLAQVVPNQYLGYSLQTTRFLSHLLGTDPGSTISLEVFEDVGVESADGGRLAEQDKSVLPRSQNPVSDRSEQLWKTFANWIDAVECKQLELGKATFIIYVSSDRTGEIVQSFSDAHSLEVAAQALTEAQMHLWGAEPNFPLRSSVAASIQQYVDRVFHSKRSVVCEIIRCFTLDHGSGSPQTDLRMQLSKTIVPEDSIEDTLDYALGWVKRQTDLLLEQGKPATISRDVFFLDLGAFVRKHDRRTVLTTLAGSPRKEEIEAQRLETYVRQLEIVEFDDDDKFRAISDFLRAAIDRTQWAVRGYVHSSSFDEFEDSLIRSWQNYRTQTFIEMRSNTDEEKGRYLCTKCLLHPAKLEGLAVPADFIPGSLHAIANIEAIGWHPNYKDVLRISRTE